MILKEIFVLYLQVVRYFRVKDISTHASDSIDKLWDHAYNCMKSGDLLSARSSLLGVLMIDPENAAALNRIGIIYAKQRRYRRSLHYFKRAVSYEGTASAYHNLGLIYYELSQYSNSRDCFLAAIKTQPDYPARWIALAKTEEKLGNTHDAAKCLRKALELEPSKHIRGLYINVLAELKGTGRLSDEAINALRYNKEAWVADSLDNFTDSLRCLKQVNRSLVALLNQKPYSQLCKKSKHTTDLAYIMIHNVEACGELIERSYSHAAQTLLRSIFEIYLKTAYASNSKTYRGYAELDRQSIISRLNSEKRLIKSLSPSDNKYIIANQKITHLGKRLAYLENKYKNIKNLGSLRVMAIELDGGTPGKYHDYYVKLYENGSDSVHAETILISRTLERSGKARGAIFNEAYIQLWLLIDLLIDYSRLISQMPEIPVKKSLVILSRMNKAADRSRLKNATT